MIVINIAIAAIVVVVTYTVGHHRGFAAYRRALEQQLREVYREAGSDRSLARAVRRLHVRLFWSRSGGSLEPPSE